MNLKEKYLEIIQLELKSIELQKELIKKYSGSQFNVHRIIAKDAHNYIEFSKEMIKICVDKIRVLN